MIKIDNLDYQYTSLFCEENIWHLIKSLLDNHYAQPMDVLFITNQSHSIALFEQTISDADRPVIWDYHVILSALKDNQVVIFDFDSRCTLPDTIQDYFELTFPSNKPLLPLYQPLINTINANYYLENFYSDRKHMQGLIEKKQYPNYDIIKPLNNKANLTLEQCINTEHTNNNLKLELPEDYLKRTLNL